MLTFKMHHYTYINTCLYVIIVLIALYIDAITIYILFIVIAMYIVDI